MELRDIMNRYPLTVQVSSDLALARQMMAWKGIRHLVVLDGAELAGVLSDRDVLAHLARHELETNPQVREAMTSNVQTAGPGDSLTEAAGRMSADKIGCLVVTERGRVVGLVTTTDVLAAEVRRAMAKRDLPLRAADLVTGAPFTAEPDDYLMDAAGRMQSYGVRHLPVVGGTGRVVGMLSDRDLRSAIGDPSAVFEKGRRGDLEGLRVADAMTRDPIVIHGRDSISSVSSLFVDHRLSAVPVLDDEERLLGVVSYIDILRAI